MLGKNSNSSCILLSLFFYGCSLLGMDFPMDVVSIPLPRTPEPGAVDYCISCSGGLAAKGDKPFIKWDGIMAFNVRLANCQMLDASGLFLATIGEQLAYRPSEFYSIVPPDEKGDRKILIFRQGTKKIGFSSKSGNLDSDSILVSESTPGFFIKRENNNIVTVDSKNKIEYVFLSVDYGATWKLDKIRKLDNQHIYIKCEYDKTTGNIKSITLPDNSSYNIEYNPSGAVSKLTGPDGEYTVFSYDLTGNMNELKSYIPVIHPLHPKYQGGKDRKAEKPILVRHIVAEFDSSARMLSIVLTNGDKYTCEYRSDEDKKAKTKTLTVIATAPDGKKTFFERSIDLKTGGLSFSNGIYRYDKSTGAYIKDANGYAELKKIGHAQLVSSRENRGSKASYKYDQDSTFPSSKTDKTGLTTHYKYNTLGLITEVTYPDGQMQKYSYDAEGRVLSETNRAGETVSYEYKDGIIVKCTNAYGVSCFLRYDNASKLPIKLDYSNGDVYHLTWDSNLRLEKMSRNDGASVEWKYRGASRLPVKLVDYPSGRNPDKALVYEYDYEPSGRLSTIVYPDKTTESWKYNCCNIIEFINRIGKTTKFSYNERGNLVKMQKIGEGQTLISYNETGKKTKIVYPNKEIETWAYDENGHVISQCERSGNKIDRQYDTIGNLISEIHSSGAKKKWIYDSKNRLVSIHDSVNIKNNYEIEYDENNVRTRTRYFKDFDHTGQPCDVFVHRPSEKSDTHSDDAQRNEKSRIELRSDGYLEYLANNHDYVLRYLYRVTPLYQVSLSKVSETDFVNAKTWKAKNELFNNSVQNKYAYNAFDRPFETRDAMNKLISRHFFGASKTAHDVITVKDSDTIEKVMYGKDYSYDLVPMNVELKKENIKREGLSQNDYWE